jgi:hypothetical protein
MAKKGSTQHSLLHPSLAPSLPCLKEESRVKRGAIGLLEQKVAAFLPSN